MRNHVLGMRGVLCGLAMLVAASTSRADETTFVNPCLGCHGEETPKVVEQWQAGKHSKSGVKCYVCHFAEEGNPAGEEHNGFFVVAQVPATTCESCHPGHGSEFRQRFAGNGKHP